MNIGSLYLVKKLFWFLFPTKETATYTTCIPISAICGTPVHGTNPGGARIWSIHLNCEVNYFSPETLVVFLEEDGIYKKVLTSDGRIGWTWFDENDIWFDESYKNYFEEVLS